uniref:Uncharacterized protein n=1 Tax=Setaria digitata TaxID=48799 RepID=A0A915Q590_9BILA
MSTSDGQENEKENRAKRQSADSPSTVMSPSVRPLAVKQLRLSRTPLRQRFLSGHQTDSSSSAVLKHCLIEETEVPIVINCPDPNIESSLVEEISQIENTTTSTSEMHTGISAERTESECDDIVNITAAISPSIASILSPGMSIEMKSAIHAYLKSASMHPRNLINSEEKENFTGIEQTENAEKSNSSVSNWDSHKTSVEKNSKDSVGVDLSILSSEMDDEMSGATFQYEIHETREMGNATEDSFTEGPVPSLLLEVENEKAAPLSVTKSVTTEAGGIVKLQNVLGKLSLSAHKNRVLTTRNLKLDKLSSPRELANYAEERAQDYSFLINEAYCDTSVFCENCYAMRIELGLFSDKFAAMAGTMEGSATKTNLVFVAELENLLREKQAEIIILSAKLKDLTQINDQLNKQKEIAEKDVEDYKFFFKEEMKKKLEEMDMLRKKASIVRHLFLSKIFKKFSFADLYSTEELISELKQEKTKLLFKENFAQTEEYQAEVLIKTLERQLEISRSLHQKNQQNMKELENEREKDAEEKNQLSAKLRKALIDLECAKSDKIKSDEPSYTLVISLLEARVAELADKIDDALHIKEDKALKEKSFLCEKLASLLEKMRVDVKNKVFGDKWETDDIENSIAYFEKAVSIICQDTPQFETLVEAVAQRKKLARDEFEQLESRLEEAVEEKKKWEMLFLNEKSNLDSLQEVLISQFSENRNYISDLFQDFRKNWTDILYNLSGKNRDNAILEMLQHMIDLQEKLNEKWSKAPNELFESTTCLKKQHDAVTSSVKLEMQKMDAKIELLREAMEKVLENSNSLLDGLRKDDQKKGQEDEYKSLIVSFKNEWEEQEKEKNVFKKICKCGEDMIQELKRTIERLQKAEEDLKSQNAALSEGLNFECGNFARAIHAAKNLIVENNKLENDNVELKNQISVMTKENTDLKDKKTDELEHRLHLLQKENERLEKACDEADEEVGDLKQQIFELLRMNAKLEAEMRGENEEAVNRRLGYIGPPTIYPSIHRTPLEANSRGTAVDAIMEGLPKSKVDAKDESRTLAEQSPKLRATSDQSCRTS